MKTEFKEGDKFIIEIGNRLDEDKYEIVGTNLYVRTDQLRKLTPYAEENKLAVLMAYYKGLDDAIGAVEESGRLNHHQDGRATCAHEYEHRHFLKILRELPPAQPERTKGRWIKMSDADGVYYCCSECGEELYRLWSFDREFDLVPHKVSIAQTRYCPNCGADMRGEE